MCEKPRIRCAECPHRRFLPLTDDVIRWHLSGADTSGDAFVAGVYPLLPDETCRSLAIDFDKSGWREDAVACLETCRRLNLPAAVERSRSGMGAHLWLFFEEPIPAALARRVGSYVLTETMEQRPELGLNSYDRLFPSQDTMPHGGFGSLIALPLQKRAAGPGKQRLSRRRSQHTEAFLFRRLETLAETKGRFRLNERLPIAFDSSGALEADLLCADSRVVIELDGAQHLADAEAYRRDRRKDRLLQENGYFLLRFLAEDVGKDRDSVLDAILRLLGRRA